MSRKRFPAASLSSAALAALAIAAPGHAQSAPTPVVAPAPAAAPVASQAKIADIQVARDGETISILVKLTQQPAAASVKNSAESLTLEIDGLTLVPLSLNPPAGSMVTAVQANGNRITLSGAAFGNATTVIYRNAVLIEARLAEPALRTGSSLMTGAAPAKPVPAQPAPPPPAPSHPAPAAPQPTLPPAQPTPISLTPSSPTAPIALPAPTPKPAQPAADLQSHPAPAPAAKPATALPTASIAGIDAARCTSSATELAKDAWALAAMGDQALCLLDAGKYDEAKSRLDQLAAITPLDWRVALGLAALHDHKGEKDLAKTSYLAAIDRAPTDMIRDGIKAKLAAVPAIAPAEQSKTAP